MTGMPDTTFIRHNKMDHDNFPPLDHIAETVCIPDDLASIVLDKLTSCDHRHVFVVDQSEASGIAGYTRFALSGSALECVTDALLAGTDFERTTMNCDARIRPFPEAEIQCERDDAHNEHRGTLHDYAWPGSTTVIDWFNEDRRTFHGDWPGACGEGGCVLPSGHERGHAT